MSQYQFNYILAIILKDVSKDKMRKCAAKSPKQIGNKMAKQCLFFV